MTGQIPRLSKVNLFTLFSLWMELFPSAEQQKKSQVKMSRLTVNWSFWTDANSSCSELTKLFCILSMKGGKKRADSFLQIFLRIRRKASGGRKIAKQLNNVLFLKNKLKGKIYPQQAKQSVKAAGELWKALQ